jgi:site-specific DNA recombinase
LLPIGSRKPRIAKKQKWPNKKMRVLIYARYSTDRQRETSTEDQIRLCRQRAESNGWTVESVHADDGISGSTPVASRPAGARLLADILAGRADVLLLEGLDRLSRDMVEQESLIRRIEHRNIRVVGISDGYDSAADAGARKLQRGLRGLINEVYLDDLRAKTHRGLSGQVERGHHAGGLAYGYRTVPDGDAGHRLEIHPEQASIIVEIFQRYAAGWSCQRIVADLNLRRVPSPRGSSWAVSALYGSPAKGTGILNNETYTGRYTWNRSQWVKDPDSGKRKRIERPRSEWQTLERPDLRIVEPATWQAVRRRIDTPREAGGSKGKGAQIRTLFGGLLTCGYCGGAVIAVNSMLYGCAARKDRGPSICRGIYAPRKIMDMRLLGIVRNDLLSPSALARIQTFEKQIFAEYYRAYAERAEASRKRLAELDREIENLVNAVAEFGLSDALRSRLRAAETERAELQAAGHRSTPEVKNTDLMPRYRRLLTDLKNALADDVLQARAILKDYFKEIRLEEQADGIYANLEEDQAALLIAAGDGLSLGLVAGARFCTRRRMFIWRKRKADSELVLSNQP